MNKARSRIDPPSHPASAPLEERPPRDIAVSARGVHKAYRDGRRWVEVLRGVDLEVARNEMVAITGSSGSGKSTLLHLLGALDPPDRGEITVDGERLERLGRRALASLRNRKIGFVFQFHRLLPDFDALENVMMPGRIAGLPARHLEARARALLDDVGLGERLDHVPGQLSGGERQRVAICRALVLEPPVLLADEPTGNLDPASSERVFELLLDLRRRHRTTTVLVTHDRALARRCARIFSLEDGVLSPLDAVSERSTASAEPAPNRL